MPVNYEVPEAIIFNMSFDPASRLVNSSHKPV